MKLADLPRCGHLPEDSAAVYEILLSLATRFDIHPLTLAAYLRMVAKPPHWKPTRSGIATLANVGNKGDLIRTIMSELTDLNILRAYTIHDDSRKRAHGSRLVFRPLADAHSLTHTHILVTYPKNSWGREIPTETLVCRHGKESICPICETTHP